MNHKNVSNKLYRSYSLPLINSNFNLHKHDYWSSNDYYSNNHDIRPHLIIKINDTSYCALLDTGATITVFGRDMLNVWNKYELLSNNFTNVKTADGTILSGNETKLIPISFNGQTKLIKARMFDKIVNPIVLGMNFFNEFNFKLSQNNDVKEFEISSLMSINESKEEKYLLSYTDQLKLDKILSLFLYDDNEFLGCQKLIQHEIDTGDHPPIIQHQYSYNPVVMEKIHKVIDKWLDQGVIEPSFSSWRNPIVVVQKPDNSIRVCLDARKLNAITKKDSLLTPNTFDVLTSIPNDVIIFARIDKNQAFLQTLLREEDREKTAFFVKGRGLYQFSRMIFGLCNAPSTQTRLMMTLFNDLLPYVIVYFDDIIIMAKNLNHLFHLLKLVASRLRVNNISISRSKLSVCLKKIKILGHYVDKEGIHVDESKISYIKDFPSPTTKKELQRFIGMCNWYRRHIKDFSLLSAPLTSVTKGKTFMWNEINEKAFNDLKLALISPSILKKPRWELPMIIKCDASNIGVGAVLYQIDEDNNERVLEFFSAKLNECEIKYSPTEKECLAVIKSINHFRPYIELCDLKILTDHYSLKYLLNMKVTTGRLARWILFLQPYVNCIEHRSGSLMKVPDALSRAPINNNVDDDNLGDQLLIISNTTGWYNNLLIKIMKNPFKYKNHRIINNKIFVKTSFNHNNTNNDYKEIPHPDLIPHIINNAHEFTLHSGLKATLYKIREDYIWRNMRRHIAKFIKSCIKCASVKAPNYCLTGKMNNSILPNDCMKKISIDIKGPLPSSGRQRYKYILVVMDVLSRFAWIKIFHIVKSHHIISFLEIIFENYGFPNSIIHDNASQFTSNNFKNYLIDKKIESHYIPIYTPKNNPVERLNRSIGESLIIILLDNNKNQSKWALFIDDIIFKLNSRYNHATHYSPMEVFFGYKFNEFSFDFKPIRNEEHKEIIKNAYNDSIVRFNENMIHYNKNKNSREFFS